MADSKQRHYIHGDQLEGDPSLYYCTACDVFFPESHFDNKDDSCCNHWAKYDDGIYRIGKSVKSQREFGRPVNAINLFSR